MEIELKFALLATEPVALGQRLAGLPVLSRRKAQHFLLENTYFDTPDQRLRANQVALRVRQVGTAADPRWLQTLKMGQGGDSALSQRGEWEFAVSMGSLDLALLRTTPWRDYDPDGALFAALVPQFVTSFARTTRDVKLRDGSRIEVALDLGTIEANGTSAPICELELELLAGQPQALFDIAKRIAKSVSLIPLHWSKSERGYQLAHMELHMPLRSRSVHLANGMSILEVAHTTLGEMWLQFTANLNHLRASDDPEVLHQARIGWRRFKSALQLFRKHPDWVDAPALAPLQPLVHAMARQRDLDVAAAETLPMLANAYTGGDALGKARWKGLEKSLADAVGCQRSIVLGILERPDVGGALVDMTQWLEIELPAGTGGLTATRATHTAEWILQRLTRLHNKLKEQPKDSNDAQVQHRTRILANRLRYGVEALRPLLPKRKAKRWLQEATRLQGNIGSARDIANAVDIAQQLNVDAGIVEFLRGVAFGERMHAR
jgi:inorganic triphosphatase YgiF